MMQSNEVVDLLLNFTAMEFGAGQDEVAFELASRGFFGKPLQRKTKKVQDLTYKKKKGKCDNDFVKILSHLVVLVGLFVWFGFIFNSQLDRQVSAENNEVTVQMSDAIIPELATLSGNYCGCRVKDPPNDAGPVVYVPVLKNNDDESTCESTCKGEWKESDGAVFYCYGESWAFAYGKYGQNLKNGATGENPCENFALISKKQDSLPADAYDILTHDSAIWYAEDDGSGSVLDTIIIGPSKDLERSEEDSCLVLRPYGLAMDQLYYSRLGSATVADRPVYYSLGRPGTDDGEFIVYNGRRWMLVKQNLINDDKFNECRISSAGCYERYFKNGFNPYRSSYHVRLISDPMALQTDGDTWIPTSHLRWYDAVESIQGRLTTPDYEEKSVFEATEYHDLLIGLVNTGTGDDQIIEDDKTNPGLSHESSLVWVEKTSQLLSLSLFRNLT